MGLFVEFEIETGLIHGWGNRPSRPEQKDIPKGRDVIEVPPMTDMRHKKVVGGKVVRDLEAEKEHKRSGVRGRLVELDQRRLRAITDVLLKGDKTALQAIEDEAEELRAELKKI